MFKALFGLHSVGFVVMVLHSCIVQNPLSHDGRPLQSHASCSSTSTSKGRHVTEHYEAFIRDCYLVVKM